MIIRALGALGIGALVMYYFDPVSGNRRRALLRDRTLHYRKEARHYAEAAAQDLRRLARRRSRVDIDLSQPRP
jgi:hypothetical protein